MFEDGIRCDPSSWCARETARKDALDAFQSFLRQRISYRSGSPEDLYVIRLHFNRPQTFQAVFHGKPPPYFVYGGICPIEWRIAKPTESA
jgi:hypothetical protein